MTEFLDMAGGRIAYDVTGEGPLVVLSHGIGVSRQERLGDRHPPSDLRVLTNGKQGGCISRTPRA